MGRNAAVTTTPVASWRSRKPLAGWILSAVVLLACTAAVASLVPREHVRWSLAPGQELRLPTWARSEDDTIRCLGSKREVGEGKPGFFSVGSDGTSQGTDTDGSLFFRCGHPSEW